MPSADHLTALTDEQLEALYVQCKATESNSGQRIVVITPLRGEITNIRDSVRFVYYHYISALLDAYGKDHVIDIIQKTEKTSLNEALLSSITKEITSKDNIRTVIFINAPTFPLMDGEMSAKPIDIAVQKLRAAGLNAPIIALEQETITNLSKWTDDDDDRDYYLRPTLITLPQDLVNTVRFVELPQDLKLAIKRVAHEQNRYGFIYTMTAETDSYVVMEPCKITFNSSDKAIVMFKNDGSFIQGAELKRQLRFECHDQQAALVDEGSLYFVQQRDTIADRIIFSKIDPKTMKDCILATKSSSTNLTEAGTSLTVEYGGGRS